MQRRPVIRMSVNQSKTTISAESMDDLLAWLRRALYISQVMGLRCRAMHSSFSLATIILVHIFVRSDKLAGGSKFQSLKRLLMDSMYLRTVADREL